MQNLNNQSTFFSFTFEEFKKYFDSSFIDHLKTSIVPHKETFSRSDLIETVYQAIVSQQYQPKPPREYIIFNKHNLVTRVVPTFHPEDYCVYFFCVKYLEDILCDPSRRTSGTFGGWRLGNSIRDKEQIESIKAAKSSIEITMPYSAIQTIDPKAWRKSWKEFQKLCFDYANDYSLWRDSVYIIKFDISNFYDCISLNFLEHEIRLAAKTKRQVEVIDLLMFFLRFWNRHFEGYRPKTSGIPQAEIGDCSRILANFYLQPYDRVVSQMCKEQGAHYLRYADDQIIFANDEASAKDLLFNASIELHKLGLNINSSKVDLYSNLKEYNDYWSFDIFKLLETENHEDSIKKAFRIFEERLSKGIKFRHDSVLRRLFSVSLKCLSESQNEAYIQQLLDTEFLVHCDYRTLKKIYKLLPEERKAAFFATLDKLSYEVKYNSFHYNYLMFMQKNSQLNPKFSPEALEDRIQAISYCKTDSKDGPQNGKKAA